MLKFNSLKKKMFVYLVIGIFPIMLVLSYIADNYLGNALYENAVAKSRMIAFKTARKIENLNFKITSRPELIAYMFGKNILSLEKSKILMRDFVKKNKYVYGMALALYPKYSPDKKPFCYYVYISKTGLREKSLVPPEYDYVKYPWFYLPMEKNMDIWSEPYFDKGGGEIWMCTYSALIKNDKGEKIGIATADISIQFLSRIISEIKVLKTGGAFLFTSQGNLLAPLGLEREIPSSVKLFLEKDSLKNFKKIASELSGERTFYRKTSIDGKRYFIFYFPVSNTNWFIGVVFPESELFVPLKKVRKYFLSLIVVALLLFFFIISFISRRLTQDIEKVKDISREIAGGNFDIDIPMNLSDEARDMAEALNAMQKSLKELLKKEKQAARMENELELARRIQKSFIPEETHENFDKLQFIVKTLWAKEVGGDFYGIYNLGEGKTFFYIGDVSGKGVPAALYVAIVKTMVEVLVQREHSILSIMKSLNNYLVDITRHCNFATVFMGVFDKEAGVLEYCNAGHTPPFFVKNQFVFVPLLSGNVPLGTMRDFNFKIEKIKIEDFDSLFLYTDGITDCENRDEKQFGEESLVRFILDNAINEEAFLDSLFEELMVFKGDAELFDDTTAMFCYFKKE